MRSLPRLAAALLLVATLLSSALPCGPSYVSPLFDTSKAPEYPFADFAAGRLGLVRASYPRSVLYAAYRYIAGNGMNAEEQKAIVEIWEADLNNKDFNDNDVSDAVKAWIARRKEVVGDEEKTPDVYIERSYGGYDFFPNCTRNAFETASLTLADRITSHGATDKNVRNWLDAQDRVFENCASGKRTPENAPVGAPAWLIHDREYQKAAAEFYSMDYEAAKGRFRSIAADSESVWAETAEYLVGRTLVRQASLSNDKARSAALYEEAEKHLERIRSGKFTAAAARLLGLVAYRLRPRERVTELAQILGQFGAGDNFRQDVIDYTWLLDKFESEALKAADDRAAAAKNANTAPANTDRIDTTANRATNSHRTITERKNDDDLEVTLYAADYSYSWTFFVRSDATDADAIAEAERVVGKPLDAEAKRRVTDARQAAYSNRFSSDKLSDYEGGYYASEPLTPSLLPDILLRDDLTDWLYTFQMSGDEAYLRSLQRYKTTSAAHWLMSTISKAEKSSTQLDRVLDGADNTSRMSPAWPTIAFHRARLLLQTGKTDAARKQLDDLLDMGDRLPVSARNAALSMRVNITQTLDEFLRFSLKKAYAFDFGGTTGTIDSIIAEQKTWYDPEYNKNGREAYEIEVEERFKVEKLWQDRLMFDDDTIAAFNHHFPTSSLVEVLRSKELPAYLRERFIVAIWTRAFILNDHGSLERISREFIASDPANTALLERALAAKTHAARERALLYFVLKMPLLSPYIQDGMGKTNNEQEDWSIDDWWCEPYDPDPNEPDEYRRIPERPAFLTEGQSRTAQDERKRMKATGDAPNYLGEKVLAWAAAAPADRRVPEALYLMIQANGWNKYGCGNSDRRDELVSVLKRRYPSSVWTAKLSEDERER